MINGVEVTTMKLKSITIFSLCLLIISSFQAYASIDDVQKISEQIVLRDLKIIEDETYSFVQFTSPTDFLEIEGKPVLPQITRTFKIPFGSKITSVDIAFSDGQTVKLNLPLQPGPIPVPLNTINIQKDIPTESLYESLSVYPETQFQYFTSAGRINDMPMIFLTIFCYPVRYDTDQHILLYYTNIDLKIEYEPPEKQYSYPDEYDMVIITPEIFSSDLQPLIDHKNDVGIKTFLKTTEEIYNQYSGVDKPEQIKYFIKDALDTYGIEFVLLVGGLNSIITATPRDDRNQGTEDWYLPVRYANVMTSHDPGLISDLYYADIYDAEGNFSSWDPNNDGIFASYKSSFDRDKDEIDLVPELAVGRLACRSIDEVNTVVNKIITYETTAYGSDWVKNFVLIGGDTFDESDGYVEGEIETQKSFDYVEGKGYNPIRIWASNRDTGGLVPESEDIVSSISNGAGLVHFAGHGSPELWNTHWVGGPFDRSERAEGIWWYHMLQMKNVDKQPIVVIGGCHNSQFNVTLTTFIDYWINKIYETTGIEAFKRFEGSVYTPIPECFGWFFVRNEGGAIATIGNTGTGIGSTGNLGDRDGDGVDDPDFLEKYCGYLETLYFKSIGVNNVEYAGTAWQDAITMYLSVYPGMKDQTDAKSVEQWVLLGDPSLKIGGYE